MKIDKKKVLSTLFFVAVFAFTIWTVFSGEDLSETFGLLKKADDKYILHGIVCVLGFILSESVIIYYLLYSLGKKAKLGHCCLYSFIGFFYSSITPSASGGQPMQAVAMRKDGISYAVSSVVLAIVTITYKAVLVFIGAAVLVIRPDSVMQYLEPVESIVYLGIVLNVGCVAILLLLVFKPAIVNYFARKFLHLLNRIFHFKNYEKKLETVDRLTEQYTGTSEFYKRHPLIIFNVFVITVLQRIFLFAITWFTYLAFGLNGYSFALIIVLQTMISVAADMLPLPGGMGVSENLFLEIFLPIFGEALVLPGMLISRGISFYTQIIICGIMTALASFILKRKVEQNDVDIV